MEYIPALMDHFVAFKSNIFVNECWPVFLQSLTHRLQDFRKLGKTRMSSLRKNRFEITSREPFFLKVACFKLGKWKCKVGGNL